MVYRLKLIRGRSYIGRGLKATAQKPFVETVSEQTAEYLVACGRFELVETIDPGAETDSGGAGESGDDVPGDGWTVAQLRAYAGENGIDLTGVKNVKADILAKIQEAESVNDGESGVDFGEDE
jgi:hypothetical protein